MQRKIRFSAVLVLIVIVLAIPLALATCTTDQDSDDLSAIDTVRAIFSAANQNDRDTLAGYFCEPSLAALSFPTRPDSEDLQSAFDNLAFTETTRAEEHVRVTVSGTTRSARATAGSAVPFGWALDVQTHNGAWCVASIMQSPDS